MANQIFTKESLKEIDNINNEVAKAKEFIKNSRALILGGAYGASLSVGLQLIFSPIINPSLKDAGGLIFTGFFLIVISSAMAIGYYRRLFYYGRQIKSFNLYIAMDFDKGKSLLIKNIKNAFGSKLIIDSINNEGGPGLTEDILYIHDPQKEKWTARLTYVPKSKLILLKIDLESKDAGELIKVLKFGVAGI